LEKAAKPTKPPKPEREGISYEASLIFSLSLLVVLTGLSVSLIAFHGTRKGTTQLAHDLFQEVSDHAVTQTRDFLERAVPISRVLSDLSGLGLATEDHDQLARQLLVVLRASDGVSWVSYGDEAGSFVGAYRTRSGQLRVNQSHIDPSGKTSVVEHDILPDGTWKLFRKDPDSAYDPRKRPYYTKARQAGRIVWTEPYVFYDQAIPGVTCANPLFDKDGKLKGVITVDFDLDTLTRFVERQSVGANSRLFIMTPDGVLLAHPAQRKLAEAAERAAAQARAGTRGKGELLKVGELDDPLLNAFMAQLTAEDRSPAANGADHAHQFEFELSGTHYFARATSFSVSGDLVWIVGAVAPQSDFLANAWRTNALATSASLGAMLIAVIVAMILARRVSGPVRSLVSFMDSVRSGDLTRRLRLSSRAGGGAREFRQLSEALDRM
jgi:adenylate cyclase